MRRILLAVGVALGLTAIGPWKLQIQQYQAPGVKSVVELQQFRQTNSIDIRTLAERPGRAELINLNPKINSWFLLNLKWSDGRGNCSYHLENSHPGEQQIALAAEFPYGLVITQGDQKFECNLWSQGQSDGIAQARLSAKVYASLCQARLFLRNPTAGHHTTEERVADILRDHFWQGEQIISLIKSSLWHNAFLDLAHASPAQAADDVEHALPNNSPESPSLDPINENQFLPSSRLAIEIENPAKGKMLIGHWYRAADLPGIFASTITPALISTELKRSLQGQIQPLDTTALQAQAYLVAFNLSYFDAGFALGTEHPGVGWSERAQEKMVDKALPGPDGIGSIAPLVGNGMLSPAQVKNVVASFAGGFKRHHGAFRYGELALKNHGSHYGFIQDGVVLSKLEPGLATFVAYADGSIELKTWSEGDNARLEDIRYARQNGAPIIDYDRQTNLSQPGRYVRAWTLGNWSGAQDTSERTLRAGLCLQERNNQRFLIYGYFSSATPSAMAQIFQAYHCRYAMHLDMNALEHTYLAVYRLQNSGFQVEHLIDGMQEVDKLEKGQLLPRFAAFADNRDFFYLTKKGTP